MAAADVAPLAGEGSVRRLAVSDGAADIAARWGDLVAAFAEGAGKLTALTLAGGGTLTLTQAQQDEGASMIAALLAGVPIETVG